MQRPCYRISQGVMDAPPPPLAGALAAWLRHQQRQVRVVDPRGRSADWSGDGPLWVHLDAGFSEARLRSIAMSAEVHFFGPALADSEVQLYLKQRYSRGILVPGDPEGYAGGPRDLAELPICSYYGFGEQPGGLFRILAGRGDRARPVDAVCREIVYLVETFSAGHLLFDDADLTGYSGWLEAFIIELKRLPWSLTFEANVNGDRRRFVGRSRPT